MKKILFLGAVLSILAMTACSSETKSTDINDLPVAVRSAVKDNFKSDVVMSKIEKKALGGDEYEIRLADGTLVKYENDQWEEVKVPAGQSVPEAYIPVPIGTYVADKHPDQKIVEIDKDSKGYDVKLSNRLELKFDANGNFVRYDD